MSLHTRRGSPRRNRYHPIETFNDAHGIRYRILRRARKARADTNPRFIAQDFRTKFEAFASTRADARAIIKAWIAFGIGRETAEEHLAEKTRRFASLYGGISKDFDTEKF